MQDMEKCIIQIYGITFLLILPMFLHWIPQVFIKEHFSIPDSWKNERIILKFHGVDSAFHIYLNGKEIGYSKGARYEAELDITGSYCPKQWKRPYCKSLSMVGRNLPRRSGYVVAERYFSEMWRYMPSLLTVLTISLLLLILMKIILTLCWMFLSASGEMY